MRDSNSENKYKDAIFCVFYPVKKHICIYSKHFKAEALDDIACDIIRCSRLFLQTKLNNVLFK